MQCTVDNLDFHENTADEATLHATSHAAYQYREDIIGGDQAYISLQKTREKTIAKKEEFHVPTSNVSIGDRQAAQSLKNFLLPIDDDTFTPYILQDDAMVLTLIHNHQSKENDSTPLSSNMMYDILHDKPQRETVISYGPLFPQSPTSPDVILAPP